jgi:dienelactone hydrolase
VSAWDFLISTGRAVFHPVFVGAYERSAQTQPGGLAYLNEMVAKVQDFQRSVDYLLTRADVDHDRLAYLGSSWGAASGAWILGVDHRFRAAVLMDGGLYTVPALAELDQVNYAPRVRTPVLMLNGRSDYFFPHEVSQKPMFELLGTPRADKRQVLFETAHDSSLFRQEVIRETLDWLDKYLGPVGR